MLKFTKLNSALKIKNFLLGIIALLLTFTGVGGGVFSAQAEEWICADSLSASTASTLPTSLIPSVTNSNSAYSKLAEKFRSGNFELYDFGTYVQYLIETLIYFAGGIAVLFIVIGGYKYMIGGVSDDKEAGKKTIMYALAGFVITIIAWSIVNAIQVFVTGGDGSSIATSTEQWVCADGDGWVCADQIKLINYNY